MIPTTTVRFHTGQRVTVDIDGILNPGVITSTYGDGTFFARLADDTLTGAISEDFIAPAVTLRNGDRLRIMNTRAQNHSVSSLSGYGQRYEEFSGANGMARYEEALARNDGKQVWITAEATVISAHRETPVTRHQVNTGDLVWFDSATPGEGGWYRITAPGRYSNDHCSLVRF